jgi:hypothetical protein
MKSSLRPENASSQVTSRKPSILRGKLNVRILSVSTPVQRPFMYSIVSSTFPKENMEVTVTNRSNGTYKSVIESHDVELFAFMDAGFTRHSEALADAENILVDLVGVRH